MFILEVNELIFELIMFPSFSNYYETFRRAKYRNKNWCNFGESNGFTRRIQQNNQPKKEEKMIGLRFYPVFLCLFIIDILDYYTYNSYILLK